MKILFLCVANSARSQIAEGLARKVLGDRAQVFSAGSHPSGKVHEGALEVLKEEGIDPSAHTSKAVGDFEESFLKGLDYVITLCAEEVCPVVITSAQRQHWPLPDPAAVEGPEQLAAFRGIREEIRQRIQDNLLTKI